MNENKAKTLALVCSIAGLAVLYFSSALAEQAAPVGAGALSLDDVGTSAKLCGNVSGAKTSKGNVFFSLQDGTGSMRVVIFNSTTSRINASGISNGGSICALGRVQEYPPGSGEIELIVSRVTF